MSFLHRLDLLAMFVGWHDNPWSRQIDRLFWQDLAWRVPAWKQGIEPDVDYPELRGRL